MSRIYHYIHYLIIQKNQYWFLDGFGTITFVELLIIHTSNVVSFTLSVSLDYQEQTNNNLLSVDQCFCESLYLYYSGRPSFKQLNHYSKHFSVRETAACFEARVYGTILHISERWTRRTTHKYRHRLCTRLS